MDFLLCLLAFPVSIVIHELGHFFTAKALGLWVTNFNLGTECEEEDTLSFVIKSRTTQYRISPIILGGFVKLAGKLSADEEQEICQQLGINAPANRKPERWWSVSWVSAGGPLTNLFVAAVLFAVLDYQYDLTLSYDVFSSIGESLQGDFLAKVAAIVASINLGYGIINLIPTPGSDGFNALGFLVHRERVEDLTDEQKKSFANKVGTAGFAFLMLSIVTIYAYLFSLLALKL